MASAPELYTGLFMGFMALVLAGFVGLIAFRPDARKDVIAGPASLQIDKLHKNMTTFEVLAENTIDGLLIQDLNAHILWCNPAYSRITGYEFHEIFGRKPQEFVVPEENRQSPEEIEAFEYDIHSGILDQFEVIQNVRKDGTLFWNQLSFAVVEFDDPRDTRVFVISRDITDQIEREKALESSSAALAHQANHDALTGLPNRKALAEAVCGLTSADEDFRQFGIVQVDLDRFKHINDTLGHAAGDTVLVRTAEKLKAVVGDCGLVCRAGGDEFTIVCQDFDDHRDLLRLGERILQSLCQPIEFNDKMMAVGASVGIAVSDATDRAPDRVLNNADIALYFVKKSGRKAVQLFDSTMGESFVEAQQLLNELRLGLDDGQLDVHFQPQLDPKLGTISGLEALIRWYHPERGILGPGAFLGIAQENAMLAEVDAVALHKALAGLYHLRKKGLESLTMSINVSTYSLQDLTFADKLLEAIERFGLEPGDVVIEILETTLFDDAGNIERSIDRLNALGCSIELDDFGTGHAGLSHLASLKLTGLKIDRQMTSRLTSDPVNRTIVESVVELCNKLDVRVVAEGVETRDEADALVEFGTHALQGFGIAKPMPLAEIVHWLKRFDPARCFEDCANTEEVLTTVGSNPDDGGQAEDDCDGLAQPATDAPVMPRAECEKKRDTALV